MGPSPPSERLNQSITDRDTIMIPPGCPCGPTSLPTRYACSLSFPPSCPPPPSSSLPPCYPVTHACLHQSVATVSDRAPSRRRPPPHLSGALTDPGTGSPPPRRPPLPTVSSSSPTPAAPSPTPASSSPPRRLLPAPRHPPPPPHWRPSPHTGSLPHKELQTLSNSAAMALPAVGSLPPPCCNCIF